MKTRFGHDRMVLEFESGSGEVYSMQHNEIQIVSDLWWFSQGSVVSSTNKAARHDITETLLEVALNTITLPQCHFCTCTLCLACKSVFNIYSITNIAHLTLKTIKHFIRMKKQALHNFINCVVI